MKSWYLSRTLWFNGLVAVLAAVELGVPTLREAFGVDAPHFWAAFSVGIAGVNALLRVVTTQAIGRPESVVPDNPGGTA